MFPIADQNHEQRLTPVVTYVFIALNVLVFLYELTLSPRALNRFFLTWGTVPAEISRGEDLFALVTSVFVHGGWLHIGGNMLFLWVFGDNIEDIMGHARYAIFYLACGVLASLAQVAVNADTGMPLVGASGAISGVLGAYLVLFPHGKVRTVILLGWIPLVFLFPAWLQIGYWIVLQFINGFVSLGVQSAETGGGVAYFAHIGGFVAGLALVWVFRNPEAQARHRHAYAGERSFARVHRSFRDRD